MMSHMKRDLPQRAVCANIRAEMARSGLTQQDIAARIGKTRQAVSRRLTGLTEFRLDELEQIADLLGMPLEELTRDVAAA